MCLKHEHARLAEYVGVRRCRLRVLQHLAVDQAEDILDHIAEARLSRATHVAERSSYRGMSRRSCRPVGSPELVSLETNQISKSFSAPSKKWPVIAMLVECFAVEPKTFEVETEGCLLYECTSGLLFLYI